MQESGCSDTDHQRQQCQVSLHYLWYLFLYRGSIQFDRIVHDNCIFNVLISVILCGIALFIIRKENITGSMQRFVQAGSYALILGLFLEAYRGHQKRCVYLQLLLCHFRTRIFLSDFI